MSKFDVGRGKVMPFAALRHRFQVSFLSSGRSFVIVSVVNNLALGSGALVGFSLGLIGGGGSILATPLLLYVVGVVQLPGDRIEFGMRRLRSTD